MVVKTAVSHFPNRELLINIKTHIGEKPYFADYLNKNTLDNIEQDPYTDLDINFADYLLNLVFYFIRG